MSASKYVFFPLIFALMGRLSRESFSYSVLIHSHNLIQEFCRFPLCLSCSVCIDIHGGAYVRASKINNPHFFCFVIGRNFQKSGTEGKCIEAREFIIALPESLPKLYELDKLLQIFTDRFKESVDVFGSQSKIPPKPVMSAEATAYPKLFKIYKNQSGKMNSRLPTAKGS
jgi:hypothetical protein